MRDVVTECQILIGKHICTTKNPGPESVSTPVPWADILSAMRFICVCVAVAVMCYLYRTLAYALKTHQPDEPQQQYPNEAP